METALLVTGARTIAILADRFRAATCRFVLVRPVVTGVAARAVGAEGRKLPGNSLSIGFVARRTLQIAPVILWLVGQSGVTIICWCPPICGMAYVALQCRAEMIGVLTRGDRAVVTR